jgi:hypothetical protein
MLSSQDGCGGRGLPPSSSSCGDDCRVRDAKRWEMRADRVGDVARRQVRVVLFGHPRVGVVPEINDITKEHPEHPAHPHSDVNQLASFKFADEGSADSGHLAHPHFDNASLAR